MEDHTPKNIGAAKTGVDGGWGMTQSWVKGERRVDLGRVKGAIQTQCIQFAKN